MRHKFLVLTVKKWLKSVYTGGNYRKIKTGLQGYHFFGPPGIFAADHSTMTSLTQLFNKLYKSYEVNKRNIRVIKHYNVAKTQRS